MSGVDFKELATHCEHYSGADLKSLICEARLSAAHDVLKFRNEQTGNFVSIGFCFLFIDF